MLFTVTELTDNRKFLSKKTPLFDTGSLSIGDQIDASLVHDNYYDNAFALYAKYKGSVLKEYLIGLVT